MDNNTNDKKINDSMTILNKIGLEKEKCKKEFYRRLDTLLESYHAIYYTRSPYAIYVSINNSHDIYFAFENGLIEFTILGDYPAFINSSSDIFQSMSLAVTLMNESEFISLLQYFYHQYSALEDTQLTEKVKLQIE